MYACMHVHSIGLGLGYEICGSKEIISNPSKDKEDKIRQTQTQQYLTIPNNLWFLRRVCNNMRLKHLETERTTAHQSTLGSGFHGHSLGHPLNRIFVSAPLLKGDAIHPAQPYTGRISKCRPYLVKLLH